MLNHIMNHTKNIPIPKKPANYMNNYESYDLRPAITCNEICNKEWKHMKI